MKRKILIKIKYDGSQYFGWQMQAKEITVQGTLEQAIRETLKSGRIKIVGSSRTDAGVHGLEYPVSFYLDVPIPLDRFKQAVNGRLPKDIRILQIEEVDDNFHPISDAKKKTYIYRILEGKSKSPFMEKYAYQVEYPLDIVKMKEAAKILEGKHDFKSFQSMGGAERNTTVREIFSIDIIETSQGIQQNKLDQISFVEENQRIIDISVTGDGFLYNMVRIMAGTLVDIGRGKIELKKTKEILEAKDRERAGHTAPAAGLYLKKVFY